jgi:hypothetical protein
MLAEARGCAASHDKVDFSPQKIFEFNKHVESGGVKIWEKSNYRKPGTAKAKSLSARLKL